MTEVIHLVEIESARGDYRPEQNVGEHATIESLLVDIAEGQFNGPVLRILEIIPSEHVCNDVTKDAAKKLFDACTAYQVEICDDAWAFACGDNKAVDPQINLSRKFDSRWTIQTALADMKARAARLEAAE